MTIPMEYQRASEVFGAFLAEAKRPTGTSFQGDTRGSGAIDDAIVGT
jgi:hypothetical protein